MPQEFYDVKTRSKVSIDEGKIHKTTFEAANGQTRYGIRGETSDGRMLTKFVSKGDWDKMNVPVKQAEKKEAKAAPKKAEAKSDGKKSSGSSSSSSKSKSGGSKSKK